MDIQVVEQEADTRAYKLAGFGSSVWIEGWALNMILIGQAGVAEDVRVRVTCCRRRRWNLGREGGEVPESLLRLDVAFDLLMATGATIDRAWVRGKAIAADEAAWDTVAAVFDGTPAEAAACVIGEHCAILVMDAAVAVFFVVPTRYAPSQLVFERLSGDVDRCSE